MTEKDQNKTLTLKPKLGLSGPVNATQMKQSVVHQASKSSKTVTVVQMKKRSFNKIEDVPEKAKPREEEIQALFSQTSKNSLNGLTEDELNLRLKVLKEAEHKTKINRELEEQRKQEMEDEGSEAETEIVAVPEKAIRVQEAKIKEPAKIVESELKLEETEVSETGHSVSKVQLIEKNALDDAELERASKKSKVEIKLVKTRKDETRRNSGGKLNLSRLDENEEFVKTRSMASIRRAREKARKHEQKSAEQEKIIREVIVPEFITVQDLAVRMAERGTDVIKELMKLGMIVHLSNSIDADTADLVVQAFGHKIKRVTDSDVENILISEDDAEITLEYRPPVVTVMGHVDHGKTSLLDALRATDVAALEAGGITQHIGAYQIKLESGDYITFVDTPGHEAFTAMRSRGAKVTDIVILVVAADDGIMAQTVEALNHAKAAKVPIIVAINKIDKPGADVERVKNELLSHDLIPEEYGGETMVIEISAKQRTNLDKLEEAILAQAEMLHLRANPNRAAFGVVVESRIDKGMGSIATLLVQKGTLKVGDVLVAGSTSGKVRSLSNDKGIIIDSATPSMPVEITGLDEAPEAGDSFYVVVSEKQAREISEFRTKKLRNIRTSVGQRASLEELFQKASVDGKLKELPLIIKGDVNGSIEAIAGSVAKLSSSEVKVRIIHSGVGAINESDISLSSATGAMVIGFNVRANQNAKDLSQKNGVDIRYYSIIYNLIDDIKAALSGMLDPVYREEYLGNVEIRQVFSTSKFGKIAGSFVTSGIIKRGAKVRLLRDNVVIHEGKLKTLRRFKDDVKEVKEGFECGIAFENYDDIKEKDIVEVFEIIEERKSL